MGKGRNDFAESGSQDKTADSKVPAFGHFPFYPPSSGKELSFLKKKKKYIYIYNWSDIYVFIYFLAILHGMQDASSLTRD